MLFINATEQCIRFKYRKPISTFPKNAPTVLNIPNFIEVDEMLDSLGFDPNKISHNDDARVCQRMFTSVRVLTLLT